MQNHHEQHYILHDGLEGMVFSRNRDVIGRLKTLFFLRFLKSQVYDVKPKSTDAQSNRTNSEGFMGQSY
jgi:hypothetical protein